MEISNEATKCYSIERHPDWYHDIPKMNTLILGSYPPHIDKRKISFYYPNTQNRFWRILAKISGCPLNSYPKFAKEAVEERYAIMEKLCVGVQNLGLVIKRKGKSADDNDIEIIEYQDILSIINEHEELNRILLPGYSAPNSTLRGFIKYLKQNGIIIPDFGKVVPGKTIFSITVADRILDCHALNSTSTRARVPFEDIVKQFEDAILES